MEVIWPLALSPFFWDHKNLPWRIFNLSLWLKASPVNSWLRTTVKRILPISIISYISYLDFKMKVWHFTIKPLFISKSLQNYYWGWAREGSREVGFVKQGFSTLCQLKVPQVLFCPGCYLSYVWVVVQNWDPKPYMNPVSYSGNISIAAAVRTTTTKGDGFLPARDVS